MLVLGTVPVLMILRLRLPQCPLRHDSLYMKASWRTMYEVVSRKKEISLVDFNSTLLLIDASIRALPFNQHLFHPPLWYLHYKPRDPYQEPGDTTSQLISNQRLHREVVPVEQTAFLFFCVFKSM
jgi:hypothetical protein